LELPKILKNKMIYYLNIFLHLTTGQNILKWIGILTLMYLFRQLMNYLDKRYQWNMYDKTWKDIFSHKKKL